MALDTANKRFSALDVGSPWRSCLPIPDSSITYGDKQQVCFLYSGIISYQSAGTQEYIIGFLTVQGSILGEVTMQGGILGTMTMRESMEGASVVLT